MTGSPKACQSLEDLLYLTLEGGKGRGGEGGEGKEEREGGPHRQESIAEVEDAPVMSQLGDTPCLKTCILNEAAHITSHITSHTSRYLPRRLTILVSQPVPSLQGVH